MKWQKCMEEKNEKGRGGGVLFHPPPLLSTHCKDKIPKFRIKYSQKRNIGVSVPISTFMRLWVIYIFPPSVCLFCWRKYVDRSWDYINRSQTHECGNWARGRAIYRKGIISGIFVAVLHASGQIFLLTTWTVFSTLGYLLHHLGPIEYRRDGLGPSCQFGPWLGASFP